MILGFVDPYVLSCPENLDDDDSILAYVSRLIAWRDLRSRGWLQMLLPSSAPEAIADTNGFPPWKVITTLLAKKDLGIQASDVYEVLNGFLNKCMTVEEFAGVKDILIDGVEANLDYWSTRPTEHREEFHKLLGNIALLQATGGIKSEDRQMITASAPCPHELVYSVMLVDIEYKDSANLVPSLPFNIQDKLTGVCCPRISTLTADYLSVWESAETEVELRMALELCIAQFELVERVKAGPWTMGAHFFKSIIQMNLQSRADGSRIIRACRETVFGQRLEHTHAIRKSIAGNSSQIRRGTEGAMRRDIDRELHLHYWDTPRGPELASVVAHNDFSIPE
jgi:hypothetical protein